MNDKDLIILHLVTLANAYEKKSRREEEPRKAHLVGQAKGILDAIGVIEFYCKEQVSDDEIPQVSLIADEPTSEEYHE